VQLLTQYEQVALLMEEEVGESHLLLVEATQLEVVVLEEEKGVV